MTFSIGGVGFFGGHTGSAPSPFDGVDTHRLAGPSGSHPLHFVAVDELVRPTSGEVDAAWLFDGPAVVGEEITGRLRLIGRTGVAARGATLRLVGLRLQEERKSRENRDSKGNVTSSENWVEANGSLFIHDAFPEPAIPATIAPGEAWEAPFAVPAPTLGPPTAHLGEAIVAWALEVRWDIAHHADAFAAIGVSVAQHPDLLRAGVGKQGGASLMDVVSDAGGTIRVVSPLPAPVGSEIDVAVEWPGAPGGRPARVELHRRTNAPNGVEGIIGSVALSSDAFRDGTARAALVVPAGSAPSFDGAGLEVLYVVRALVDRRFLPDQAVERPVGIA